MADAIITEPFYGLFRPVLDPKRRITIPRDWRQPAVDGKAVAEKFVLCRSRDERHIDVLPPAQLAKYYEDIVADTLNAKAERHSLLRTFFSRVLSCETDSQGRIVLPEEFCKMADLQTDTVVLGAYDHFEIWNPQRWEAAKPDEEAAAARVAANQNL